MKPSQDICILCAWRENCQKKFSVSGKDMRCPDFVRDLMIKETAPDTEETPDKKKI